MTPLVFASTSRYKLAQFARLNLPFKAMAPPFDEEEVKGAPKQLAIDRALGKALSLSAERPNSVIVGSDQTLEIEGEVLGKPGTHDRALIQLQRLRGKTHYLHSAYALVHGDRITTGCVTAAMTARHEIGDRFLSEMIAKDDTTDCCGAYKWESMGIFLFDRVEVSDHNAIVGLPLLSLIQSLIGYGFFPFLSHK
ncbi:MAG: Maf family protein [Acidobacteria bacterium]|nr:Maf family protein [Acidobacteriota bacterium]